MRTPGIELLWWEGCPSTVRALDELRAALDELGLEEAEVRMREVRSDEEAESLGFPGSPTILIDGHDPFAAPDGVPASLTCRVYTRADGQVAPTPDPEALREALRRAR